MAQGLDFFFEKEEKAEKTKRLAIRGYKIGKRNRVFFGREGSSWFKREERRTVDGAFSFGPRVKGAKKKRVKGCLLMVRIKSESKKEQIYLFFRCVEVRTFSGWLPEVIKKVLKKD